MRSRSPSLLPAILLVTVVSAWGQTPVDGVVATTTWTKANSPYRVTGTVTVPTGEVLTIEPGIDVLFDADVSFRVLGGLRALGTEADSVRFVAGESGVWRGLRLDGGDTSAISYARVSHGLARLHDPTGDVSGRTEHYGGGIYVANSRLGLAHVVLSDNRADVGGGLFSGGSYVTLDECAIVSDSARLGGGVYAKGSSVVIFSNTTVSGNSAERSGGAIFGHSQSTLVFNDCQVSGNASTGRAGGIIVGRSSLLMARCTISDNIATSWEGYGGGIVALATTGVATVALTECTVRDNAADSDGGGIYLSEASATLTRCIVSGNRTGAGGGGVYAEDGSEVALDNCVVYRNAAKDPGGGIRAVSPEFDIVTEVRPANTILWANTPDQMSDLKLPDGNSSSGRLLASYCDVDDEEWPGCGNIIDEPMFRDADAGDFLLVSGSPCIDTGSPYLLDADHTTSDMGIGGGAGGEADLPRISVPVTEMTIAKIAPRNLTIRNIGPAEMVVVAVELPEFFTTTLAFPVIVPGRGSVDVPVAFVGDRKWYGVAVIEHTDHNAPDVRVMLNGWPETVVYGSASGVWEAQLSPYRIVEKVTVPEGDSLTIEAGVEVLFDADVQLVVLGRLTAIGSPEDRIWFRAGKETQWRGIRVGGDDSSTIRYARFTDGRAEGDYPMNYGGAVYVGAARLGLARSWFGGNTAGHGGALAVHAGAAVTVDSCRFVGNVDGTRVFDSGGAAWVGDARALFRGCTFERNVGTGGGALSVTGSAVRVIGCVIADNVSYGAGGGLSASLQAGDTLVVEDTTVEGNVAHGDGGGARIRGGGHTTLRNCAIVRNRCEDGSGGGLYILYGWADIVNCVVAENRVDRRGGGISAWGPTGEVNVTNCSLYANIADVNASGAECRDGGVLHLLNTIVWGHPGYEIVTAVTVKWYELRGVVTVDYSDVERNRMFGIGNLDTDPLLADPAEGEYALGPGSPCVDAGSPYIVDTDGTRSDIGHMGGGGPDPAIPRIDCRRYIEIPAGRTGELVIRNTGWEELELVDVTLSEGFSTTFAFPQTVATGDSVAIPIRHTSSGSLEPGAAAVVHSDAHRTDLVVTLLPIPPSAAASQPPSCRFSLAQNHPNPFNPTTTIRFSVPDAGRVRLAVYNVAGQLVRTLIDEWLSVGEHAAIWDGRDELGRSVASGVYLYRLTRSAASPDEAGEFADSYTNSSEARILRMLLVR